MDGFAGSGEPIPAEPSATPGREEFRVRIAFMGVACYYSNRDFN